MSELTTLVDTILRRWEDRGNFNDQHTAGRVQLAKEVADLLDAHDAEIREQARREQYEADCKAACYSCEAYRPVRPIGNGWWTHQKPGLDMVGNCSRIRAAWAKAHEAKEKSEDVVARSLRSRLHANETMFSEPTHG